MISYLSEITKTEELTQVEKLIQKLWDWGVDAGSHLLAAALIFIVGRILR